MSFKIVVFLKSLFKKIIFVSICVIITFFLAEIATYLSFFILGNKMISKSSLQSQLSGIEKDSTTVLGESIDQPDYIYQDVLHPYLGFVRNYDLKNTQTNNQYRSLFNKYGFVGPDPLMKKSKDALIVGIFGGSVAETFFHAAKEHLANNLRSLPQFQNKNVTIIDLALGGYKQPQQLMTLNYILTLGGNFDIIINIDGFNEVALPYAENLPSKVNSFYPRQWNLYAQKAFNKEALIQIAQIEKIKNDKIGLKRLINRPFLNSSYFFLIIWHYVDLHMESLIYQEENQLRDLLSKSTYSFQLNGPIQTYHNEKQFFQNLVDFWANSSFQMSNLSKANNILYFHFLQPNQYYPNSKHFTDEEKDTAIIPDNSPEKDAVFKKAVERAYPLLVKTGNDLISKGVNFTDLTFIFKNEKRTIYQDTCCHYNVLGYELIADSISEVIEKYYHH